MHVNMCWIGPMWPKCTFGDVIGNKDMPFTDLPDHETKKIEGSENRIWTSVHLLFVKK